MKVEFEKADTIICDGMLCQHWQDIDTSCYGCPLADIFKNMLMGTYGLTEGELGYSDFEDDD